jgi:SAM-dependent methyltransferase
MEKHEYAALDAIDRDHWFYRGKRDIVRHWIERSVRLTKDDLLVDAGVGTGIWLQEMSARCRVLGLEASDESLAIARPRVEAAGGRLLKTDLDRIDLPDETATVVTAMDVLEHLDDDKRAFAELVRITRVGGLIVITVPALRMLWSDWDVSLHHRRRYEKRDFQELIRDPRVDVVHCGFFNSVALPAILAIRVWRRFRPRPAGTQRMEDKVPPQPINAVLHAVHVATGSSAWFRPPFGVSLLAVLRRVQR